MSIGSFAAATVINASRLTYKAGTRIVNGACAASDDFAERWDDPTKGFDAVIEQTRIAEERRVELVEQKRAARKLLAARAALEAPAAVVSIA